jgi:hypothetical protein
MKKIDNQLDKSKKNQTLAEIAEQGFTVRNGHSPDSPNPLEDPISNETNDNLNTQLDLKDDEFDTDENFK